MPAWSLLTGGAGAAEWFAKEFANARKVVKSADFDTLLGEDFADTVSSELVDIVGIATASPDGTQPAGVLDVAVGDNVIAPCSARLQRTSAPVHVHSLSDKWYIAALGKYLAPLDETQLGDTRADLIGLWTDDNNYVALGIFGNGSGGSTTNWVGSSDLDASITTKLGPTLDGVESPVWHLFRVWCDGAAVHFSIDGVEFADTIPIADVAVTPATTAMVVLRSAVGDQAAVEWDKYCCVTHSPVVGGP